MHYFVTADADWLRVSRAFMIIAAVLSLVSNIVSVVGVAKGLRKVQFAGAGIAAVASKQLAYINQRKLINDQQYFRFLLFDK